MDIRHHYIEAGEGPVMIFLHGNGEDCTFFEGQIGEFAQDHCVCAIDTRVTARPPWAARPLLSLSLPTICWAS